MLDDDGEPRLVDFGLALLDAPATGQLDSSDPEQRAIVGTLAYMAPEALRGRADARSDQFSFAAALWEALHGEFPYRIDDVDPAHRVVSATSRSEKLPPALVDLLRRALAAEPLRRFPKMADLLAGLRQLQGELRAASSSASVPAIPAAINLTSDTIPSAATASAPALPRRSWAWLAFPAVGVASVIGVLAMTGFWDSEEPDLAVVAADGPEDAAPLEASPPPPPPPPVAAFSCPANALGQKWFFHTSAQWANEQALLDKGRPYDLLLSLTDQKKCRFSATLRKHGLNDRLSSDRRDVTIEALPPFTARASQEFTLDGYTYDFFFIFDGNQIRGDFRARGASDQFFGLLQGGRTEADRKVPKLDDQPCAAQCGVRCLGVRAITRCREQCGAERTARPICEAPDDDAKLTLPAWSTSPADCPAGTDPWFDGTWVVQARTKRGENRSAHRYELRLDAEACQLELEAAQKDGAPWPIVGRGKITGDRRWELELEGEGFRHTWTLAGWDPVFGTFKTSPTDGTAELTRGVLAAYRQP